MGSKAHISYTLFITEMNVQEMNVQRTKFIAYGNSIVSTDYFQHKSEQEQHYTCGPHFSHEDKLIH